MDVHALKMPAFLLVLAAGGSLLQACSSDPVTSNQTAGAGGMTTGATGSTAGTGTGTTSGTTTGVTGTTTGTATGSGGATSGTTTTTGTTGTGGTGGGTDASPLPFIVDSLYIASGFMGDGANPGAIVQDDNVMCLASRPPGSVGHCHKFTYTPIANPDGAVPWGGVYWQYPVNNWGALPGKRIAAGATKITFVASGAVGGEPVKFIVGGITGMANNDTVSASTTVTLTTTPSPYSIDITGQIYDSVLGGFGWVIEAPVGSAASYAFTVDSIRWEQ